MKEAHEHKKILERALKYAKLEALQGISVKMLSKIHSNTMEGHRTAEAANRQAETDSLSHTGAKPQLSAGS